MSPLSPSQTVAALATQYPAASRVFMRYDIDFCCGGKRPLAEACAAAGVDPAEVLRALEAETGAPAEVRYDVVALDELVAHIVTRYHRPLDLELPRLERMVFKVRDVHGPKDPERLEALADVFAGLAAELKVHMLEEERLVFPWILRGKAADVASAIDGLRDEHDTAGAALERLRELTDRFTPPPGACTTWRALYLGLAALDRELREHVHLENNVLFPRALQP